MPLTLIRTLRWDWAWFSIPVRRPTLLAKPPRRVRRCRRQRFARLVAVLAAAVGLVLAVVS